MKIVNNYEDKNSTFFVVQLAEDVFVDIKAVDSLYYVMQCEDGRMAYNIKGDTVDVAFDENAVIAFVKGQP